MIRMLKISLVSCGMLAGLFEAHYARASQHEEASNTELLSFGPGGAPDLADLLSKDDETKRKWSNNFVDFLEEGVGVTGPLEDVGKYMPLWADFKEGFKKEHAKHMDAEERAAGIMAKRLPNNDRVQCLRADELDLVVPPKDAYIMRLATGKDEHTGSDVYVTVDNIWLKKLDVTFKMTRASPEDGVMTDMADDQVGESERLGHAFDIEISGVAEHPAMLEFEVTGLRPYIKSQTMAAALDFAAKWFTKKDDLLVQQQGACQFHLTARAVGRNDVRTGIWTVDLLQKKLSRFELGLSNQNMINKISQLFSGTIENAVSDLIWAQLHQILPGSFAALTSADMEAEDLSFSFQAHIKGGQATSASPLALEVDINSKVDANPSKLLALLKKDFDAKNMVDRYVKALVEEQDLKHMWKNNRQAVANMLSRYGVKPEWVMDEELPYDEDVLKQQLLDAVTKGADAFVKGLTPFINACAPGSVNPFTDLAGAFGVQIDWNAKDSRGRKRVMLSSAVPGAAGGSTKLLSLPTNFINALAGGEVGLVVSPKVGQASSVLELTALDFVRSRLSWQSLKFTNLRLSSKSDMLTTDEDGKEKTVSTTQIWKTTGGVEDLKMVFPESWDPHWRVELQDCKCEIHPGGLVTLDLGTGVRMTEIEKPEASATEDVQNSGPSPVATQREGNEDEIFGPVPVEYQRPTLELNNIGQLDVAPQVNGNIGVKLSTTERGDGASHLVVEATGTLTAELDLTLIVKPLMASRPSEDTGYIFLADSAKFYYQQDQESPILIGDRKFVLNCGYLRIFDEAHLRQKGSFDMLTFLRKDQAWASGELTGAQFEIDVSVDELRSPEVVSIGRDAVDCIQIMDRVVSHRFRRGQTEDKLFACSALELGVALEKQVKRFQNDLAKSKRLNFGTHERYDAASTPIPQYSFPDGLGTKPLSEILGPSPSGAV